MQSAADTDTSMGSIVCFYSGVALPALLLVFFQRLVVEELSITPAVVGLALLTSTIYSSVVGALLLITSREHVSELFARLQTRPVLLLASGLAISLVSVAMTVSFVLITWKPVLIAIQELLDVELLIQVPLCVGVIGVTASLTIRAITTLFERWLGAAWKQECE